MQEVSLVQTLLESWQLPVLPILLPALPKDEGPRRQALYHLLRAYVLQRLEPASDAASGGAEPVQARMESPDAEPSSNEGAAAVPPAAAQLEPGQAPLPTAQREEEEAESRRRELRRLFQAFLSQPAGAVEDAEAATQLGDNAQPGDSAPTPLSAASAPVLADPAAALSTHPADGAAGSVNRGEDAMLGDFDRAPSSSMPAADPHARRQAPSWQAG